MTTGAIVAGSVWAGGLATLVEKKSRRMELAYYCMSRALESFARCAPPRLPLHAQPAFVYTACLLRASLHAPSPAPSLAPGPRLRRCTAEWGWVRRKQLPARLDVLLFSAAIAAITHCYSGGSGRHRDVFRSKYLNVLDFVFGNTGERWGGLQGRRWGGLRGGQGAGGSEDACLMALARLRFSHQRRQLRGA